MGTKIIPPERFDFKRPEEWEKWIRRFDRFQELHRNYIRKERKYR